MTVSISPGDPVGSFIESLSPIASRHVEGPSPYVVVVVVQPESRRSAADAEDSSLRDRFDDERRHPLVPAEAWPIVRDVYSSLRDRFANDHRVSVLSFDSEAIPERTSSGFALDYPDLKIDRARHEVRTATRPIELTKGEFALLAHLAEHPGIVFTRRQLVDACRGGDRLVDDRSVDVQIFSLRKKLGDAANHLQTIRGVGYRFVPQPASNGSTPRPR